MNLHPGTALKTIDSPRPLQLILRSINPAKSAFLAVTFESTFFETHNVFGSNIIQAGILVKVRRCSGVMVLIDMHHLEHPGACKGYACQGSKQAHEQ